MKGGDISIALMKTRERVIHRNVEEQSSRSQREEKKDRSFLKQYWRSEISLKLLRCYQISLLIIN
jgi:hypothetical protein